MLRIQNVNKSYDDRKILRNISFEINHNGITTFLGKSGSGKSTLLNIISLVDKPDSGEIFWQETCLSGSSLRKKDQYRGELFSFVFQESNLIEDLSVRENLALGGTADSVDSKTIECLRTVDMEEFIDTPVKKLSGGERQRVTIARALIRDTPVILADEPTGNLDDETGELIMTLLKNISSEKIVILVTHNILFAEKYSDKIFSLSDGVLEVIRSGESIQKLYPSGIKDIRKTKTRFSFHEHLRLEIKDIKMTWRKQLGFLIVFPFLATLLMVTMAIIRTDKYDLFVENADHLGFVSLEMKNNDLITDRKGTVNRTNHLNLGFSANIVLQDESDPFFSTTINTIVFDDQFEKYTLALGSYPSNVNEVIISDYLAEALIRNDVVQATKVEEILGEHFNIYINNVNSDFLIVGIVQTMYNNYHSDEIIDFFEPMKMIDFFKKSNSNIITGVNTLDYITQKTLYADYIFSTQDGVTESRVISLSSLTNDHIIYDEPSNENGIYITVTYLISHHGYSYGQIIGDPQAIFQEVSGILEVETLTQNRTAVLSGIFDDDDLNDGISSYVFAVDQNQIWDYSSQIQYLINSNSSSAKEIVEDGFEFIETGTFLDMFLEKYSMIRLVFLVISFILALVYCILFIGFLIVFFENKRKAFSVYLAVGMRKSTIILSVLIHNLILILFECLGGLVLASIINSGLSSVSIVKNVLFFKLFQTKPFSFLIVTLSILCINGIVLTPFLIKIFLRSPYRQIRNL